MAEFRLDAQQVEETFHECLASTEEEGQEFDGIVQMVRINVERAKQRAELIVAMLMELPEGFRQSSGGGWSFLMACNDRHGRQWGEHRQMGMLFMLGQAVGVVECPFPRDAWEVLPGGVPYYVILDQKREPVDG